MPFEFIIKSPFSIQVFNRLSTNMCSSIVDEFNPSFTIGLDNVGFNIRPTFLTLTNDSIMRFLNGIFEDYAFVIDELNSDMVDLHFVHSNESLHLSVYNNAGAFADHENIMENCGL